MAVYFLDSSAVVKRYVPEIGSAWTLDITDPINGNDIYLVRVTGEEVVSALVRKIPPLPAPDLANAIGSFRYNYQNQYQRIALTEAIVIRGMGLAEKHRLRGYDAVQLAAVVELLHVAGMAHLPGLTFVSADAQLLTAASSEHLTVDNPSLHP